MKSNVIASLAILAFIFTFTSCSTDDDPALTGKSGILTSHDWKYSSATSPDADYQDFTNTLYANMVLSFKADKTFSGTYVFGSLSGTWSFNTDETVLTTVGDLEGDFTIEQLTDNNFDFSYVDDGIFAGEMATVKFVKK